ncbi:uncharacterized protein LOC122931498 [Bufo gargarizans]|uniref:uncharacterized protein LOC122931498 n=1 Tax=Bufo gargarizans TaxID=30331 RepID=UPI001CF10F4F|nr:uncharacterized protein LOC122931498 [Bufo gargarizans]
MAIINVEKLIILVQERPLLWDTRSELYHDRVRKDPAWEELTKELHPEEWEKASKVLRKNMVKIAKTRWNSTRDQFRRELSETSRSGDGGAKKRPYIYTKQLRFLRDIMELPPTVDNLEEQTGSIDSDETQIETQKSPDVATTNPPEMSQQIQTSSGPEETPAEIHPAPRRRSRNPPVQAPTDNRAVIDSRVLDYLNRNQSESPEELMLRSLGPFLSRVPEVRRPVFMSTMNTILDIFSWPQDPAELVHIIEQYKWRVIGTPWVPVSTPGPRPSLSRCPVTSPPLYSHDWPAALILARYTDVNMKRDGPPPQGLQANLLGNYLSWMGNLSFLEYS